MSARKDESIEVLEHRLQDLAAARGMTFLRTRFELRGDPALVPGVEDEYSLVSLLGIREVIQSQTDDGSWDLRIVGVDALAGPNRLVLHITRDLELAEWWIDQGLDSLEGDES
jgi:hypothetical protein